MTKNFSPSIPYRDWLIPYLRTEPEVAGGYLSMTLKDKDPNVFMGALQDVLEAFGGQTKTFFRRGARQEQVASRSPADCKRESRQSPARTFEPGEITLRFEQSTTQIRQDSPRHHVPQTERGTDKCRSRQYVHTTS